MRVLLITICLLLNGCMYQSVTTCDIKLASKWCADKGGIHSIDSFFNGGVDVFCKDYFNGQLGTTKKNKKTISRIERELLGE